MTPDSVVVGGGIIGLCTALELARSGQAVTVLERDDAPRGASWAGGGILAALPPWAAPAALRPMLEDSLRRYPALMDELEPAGPDPEWEACGALVLGRRDRAPALDWSAESGAPFEVLDPTGVGRYAPGVEAPDGALYLPQVARLRNPRLLKALVRLLKRRDVQLRFGCEVREIQVDSGRCVGVRWADGQMSAGQVVVAAGCWTPALLEPAEVRIEIHPVRGQMLMLPARSAAPDPVILGEEVYLVRRREGGLVVGSTLESTGFDAGITDAARVSLLSAARAMVPALSSVEPEAQWAGLRPATPDGLPIIGAAPAIEGLFVNAGHFRLGITLAPASARLLADRMLGCAPTLDAGPFDPSRIPQPPVAHHGGGMNVQ